MLKRLQFFISNSKYLSTGLIFAILSIVMAFWVTRLPYLKQKLSLDDGDLGLALFFISLGSFSAILATNKLITKIGEGRVTILSTILLSISIIFPFVIDTFFLFCLTLFFVGVNIGFLDVAINAIAGYFEKHDNVIIMSTCHGFFSLGGMIGAAIGSILIGLEIEPLVQMIVTALLVILIITFFIYKKLAGIRSNEVHSNDAAFAIPKGTLISLTIISFCIFLSEGAVMDWSTIYLQEFLKADPYVVGFGYAGFSLFMTLGRFNGDYVISIFGEKKVMTYGALLAVFGTLLVLIANTYLAILGFSIMGLGYSTLIPIAFSSASRTKEFSPSYGIAAVAGFGYVGFLIGPVLMGLISKAFALNFSFIFLLLLSGVTFYGISKSSKLFSNHQKQD